ncbi:nibrin-related [Anaeramoeba flamelloides]|uniref:Nibrin-related n=1 Tax=Anaeramoeba flamelloides TaxID=1746091 RepID=A0AAV8AD72_9EUKA|nr:nibrin-related [Anaeramoeba flamelloides]
MWKLILPNGTKKTLLFGTIFLIGRGSRNDYSIKDLTVSRSHITLDTRLQSCTLNTISNSITVLNKQIVSGSRKLFLQRKNRIVLGNTKEEIIVKYQKVIICDSYLNPDERSRVDELCEELGFERTQNVDCCTHLVMSQIGVTMKFLLALIEGKHIISTDWLEQFLVSRTKFASPKANEYLPPIVEKHLQNTFSQEKYLATNRNNLFSDVVFLFLSYPNYIHSSPIIKRASGDVKLINVEKKNSKEKLSQWIQKYLQKNKSQEKKILCVFDPLREGKSDWRKVITNYQIEMISELSLGMAILDNSITKYCSPKQPQPQIYPNFEQGNPETRKRKFYPIRNLDNVRNVPKKTNDLKYIPEFESDTESDNNNYNYQNIDNLKNENAKANNQNNTNKNTNNNKNNNNNGDDDDMNKNTNSSSSFNSFSDTKIAKNNKANSQIHDNKFETNNSTINQKQDLSFQKSNQNFNIDLQNRKNELIKLKNNSKNVSQEKKKKKVNFFKIYNDNKKILEWKNEKIKINKKKKKIQQFLKKKRRMNNLKKLNINKKMIQQQNNNNNYDPLFVRLPKKK